MGMREWGRERGVKTEGERRRERGRRRERDWTENCPGCPPASVKMTIAERRHYEAL